MAKLNKLKSMIKRLNSSGSSRRVSRTASGSSIPHDDDDSAWQLQPSEAPKFDAGGPVDEHSDVVPRGLHPVYVGKSRRRYLVSSDLVGHPLFRVLVERSGGGGGTSSAVVIVGCEVVLFEHLLWMLRNGDVHPESTPDDLVDFYAC